MNEELLIKAMDIFDAPEKWNAFNELSRKRPEIEQRWFSKLHKEVFRREKNNGMPDWDIGELWGTDLRWFIKGADENSLSIHFWKHDKVKLRVCFGFVGLDQNKVRNLYKSKFDFIKSCFDRVDDNADDTIGIEIGNFSFGSSVFNGNFPDVATLAWYAGNSTNVFADQIIAKVRKFQKTPGITELFKEINEKCRRE